MDTNEKRTVMFDKNCSPYLSGECATFPVLQANTLVTRGIAHYVKKDAKGNWVPVKGEKSNDDDELLKADADTDSEQKIDDGHESDDDSESADGDDGDDSGESDDDSEESDDDSDESEDDDESDDGKKQAGRKRGRVKL